MNAVPPQWLDALTAALVVIGALAALIGSFGLLRLESLFRRVHAPTLGATVGTWGVTLAMVLQMTFAAGQLYIHALLVTIFIPLTAPVTTVLLMRAALFRARLRRDPGVPLNVDQPLASALRER
jgi:multicomponent K+:H+ antiporter subunit G